tara:strand:+ start:238 stop:357 length:120 start_codon:yes stop_codon:yes gene_type:complete
MRCIINDLSLTDNKNRKYTKKRARAAKAEIKPLKIMVRI